MSLRPVDLARAAGISTQQVRNYAEAGILPPTQRTATGYRVFTERHSAALLTMRALVKGYGVGTAQSLMLVVHSGDIPLALTMIDAAHAALHEQRGGLEETGKALEAVAEQPSMALPKERLPIGEVAKYLGVRTSALRVWEAEGLLAPERERGTGYRSYRPADVRDARMIHLLRQSYYPIPAIAPVLDDLRRSGSSEALRAAIAQRQTMLIARSLAMLEGSSHLHNYLLIIGIGEELQ